MNHTWQDPQDHRRPEDPLLAEDPDADEASFPFGPALLVLAAALIVLTVAWQS